MADKNWTTSYNVDDNSKLRNLQLVELEIMRIFSEICDRHNLRYFLIGGTMLGAVRHQGFIPWDDDMDVGMPRPDYERFIGIVKSELPEGYDFLHFRQEGEYKRYFSRVVNTNVQIVNASYAKPLVENAWIDIFPFDGMPSGKLRQKLHFWHMTATRFFYHAACFNELVNLNRPGRAWYLRAAIRFISITHIGSNLNAKKQLARVEKQLLKYPYDQCDYVINLFGAYMSKEIVAKRLLGTLPRYRFEDLLLPGPEYYDPYLRQFYGDYMQPPKDADKDKHNLDAISYDKEQE